MYEKDGNFQEYQITTLRSLRQLLRSYGALRDLAVSGDFTSAAIMLDLAAALGDDPQNRIQVLTPRQKQAITLHLLQDRPKDECATEMGVTWRVMYLIVNNGLRRLQRYLNSNQLPNTWQPWQLEYVRRNSRRPREEIAAYVGRSNHAVRHIISKLHKSGELVCTTGRGRRATRPGQPRKQGTKEAS